MLIRDWRKLKGFNFREGAEFLGIPISTLHDLEHGSTTSFQVMAKVIGATAGAVTADDFMRGWRLAHVGEFSRYRSAGRAAARAFTNAHKEKKHGNGTIKRKRPKE